MPTPESKLLKLKSKHLTEILIIEEMVLLDLATKTNYMRLADLNIFISKIKTNIKLVELENKQKHFYLN